MRSLESFASRRARTLLGGFYNRFMLLAVLTVSDRCSKKLATDTAGPAVVAILRENWPDAEIRTSLVADEVSEMIEVLSEWCSQGVALILTTGGTGLGPRDRTPEATRQVIEREAPGLAEAMRAKGSERNPFAWLSRGVAGLKGKSLIVNLPGSRRGAQESLVSILPLIRHGLETMSGSDIHP
jgi:molybdopterin adenylyltransferase